MSLKIEFEDDEFEDDEFEDDEFEDDEFEDDEFEDDKENILTEIHNDGKVYLFDSNDLYTGPWKVLGSRYKLEIGEKTPLIVEGFIKNGVKHGKWIERNNHGSIKTIDEYHNGQFVKK